MNEDNGGILGKLAKPETLLVTVLATSGGNLALEYVSKDDVQKVMAAVNTKLGEMSTKIDGTDKKVDSTSAKVSDIDKAIAVRDAKDNQDSVILKDHEERIRYLETTDRLFHGRQDEGRSKGAVTRP